MIHFDLLSPNHAIEQLPANAFDDEGEFQFWLLTSALKEQELNLSKTWVLLNNDDIIGFFTTRISTYSSDAKGVYLLAKLAVLQSHQKQGYGKVMLSKCIEQAQQIMAITGCVGVMGYAKPTALGFYKKYGFTPVFGNQILLKAENFKAALKHIAKKGKK